MTGPSQHTTTQMTTREYQQVYELTSGIKTKVTVYLSQSHSDRRTYDATRLLMHLPLITITRIHTSLNAAYSKHLCRFLAHTSTYVEPEFIDAYLDLLPKLTEAHRDIANDYFITLARWLDGSALSLDLMVRYSTQYRNATGSETLPYTAEADQRLFTLLSKELRLIDPILERVDHPSQITPELLNELTKVHPALIDGAL